MISQCVEGGEGERFGEGLIVMLMNDGTDSSWSVSCLWHVNNAAYAMNYGYTLKDKDLLLFLMLARRPECALSCLCVVGFLLTGCSRALGLLGVPMGGSKPDYVALCG